MSLSLPLPTSQGPTRSGAVAIVASAGGIEALIDLFGALPQSFATPIFVAQHLARGPSNLDHLLSRRSGRQVVWAVNNEQPAPGLIYLAPPGASLCLTPTGMRIEPLGRSSLSWLASADSLIESVLSIHGKCTIAIVLSGMLPAGISGLRSVRAAGGLTIAQSPVSAASIEMPSGAIDLGKAEITMTPQRMALAIEIAVKQWSN
jgi:two-component system chemotaxis response regulator CheB